MQNISARYPDNSFSNVRVFGEIVLGDPEPSAYYIRWTGPYGGYGPFLVNYENPTNAPMPPYSEWSDLADYSSGVYTNFNGELRDEHLDYDPQKSTRCYTDFHKTYISTFETNAYYTGLWMGDFGDVGIYEGEIHVNYSVVNSRLRNTFLYRTKYIGAFAFQNCINLSNVVMSKVVSIDEGAFWGCFNFPSNLYLPKCKYIGPDAFHACNPPSYYDGNVYYDTVLNSKITFHFASHWAPMSTVTLPVCEYIGHDAFAVCSLNYADLGNCSYIGSYAFWMNTPGSDYSFTMILRGSSVCSVELGNRTPYEPNFFYGDIWRPGITQVGYVPSILSIYVPSSLVSDYKSAAGWKVWKSNIYPIPSSMTS